jgi:hypothetical protein
MEGETKAAKAKDATLPKKEATEKVIDTAKVTVKDGGETSPTLTRFGGEATARKIRATQKNSKTEKSPKKRLTQRGPKATAATAISKDTSIENAEKG